MDKSKYYEVSCKRNLMLQRLYVEREKWQDASVVSCNVYDYCGRHMAVRQKSDLEILPSNQENIKEYQSPTLSKDQIFDLFLETFANDNIFEVAYKDDTEILCDCLTLQEAKDYVQNSRGNPHDFIISCRVLQPTVSEIDFKKVVK